MLQGIACFNTKQQITGGTVVEHLTHNPNIGGSNPCAGALRWKMPKCMECRF